MGCSTNIHRVATVEGTNVNSIAPPLRNINVIAFPEHDFGPLHRSLYLSDSTIEYPHGDHRGQAGWDIGIPYAELVNLADKLEAGVKLDACTERRFGPRYAHPIQRGEISRLAFLSHGDLGGQWYGNGKQYYPLMAKPREKAEAVSSAAPILRRISAYTKPFGATIILLGCLAGQEIGGTDLLMALSEIWPTSMIVGFDVIGYRHPGEMTKGHAGDGELAGMRLTWCRSEVEYHAVGEERIQAKWDEMEWASELSKQHAKIVMNRKLIRCPPGDGVLCPEDGLYPVQPTPSKRPAINPTPKPSAPIVPSWKQRPPFKPR